MSKKTVNDKNGNLKKRCLFLAFPREIAEGYALQRCSCQSQDTQTRTHRP